MNKIYIVKYYDSESDQDVIIFATTTKSIATKYVTKFNRIIKKWSAYFRQFEGTEMGIPWIKNEYLNSWVYHRWLALRYISSCKYEEVKLI